MKVQNALTTTELHPELQRELDEYRRQRRFNPQQLASFKATLLNDYMREHGLKACVIGVSGGIDSAVALRLLDTAAQRDDSPIEKIVALSLPALRSDAVTRQMDAYRLAAAAVDGTSEKVEFGMVDLTDIVDQTVDKTFKALYVKSTRWSRGQLVPCMRTPILYFAASLLVDQGLPALVIGTINRDEGAYLGYVGKASDGMVDLQLISDLHKSEVKRMASYFGVPEEIQQAAPSPDMFDGRTDEEVFGAPYDFVELYLSRLVAGTPYAAHQWYSSAKTQYDQLRENVEKIHAYNAHKYLVGSPAIHLDVYESAVPGGWEKTPEPPQNTKFVNAVDAKLDVSGWSADPVQVSSGIGNFDYDEWPIQQVEKLFRKKEVKAIREALRGFEFVPANHQGYQIQLPCSSDAVGSWRLSWHNEDLADLIWRRIRAGLSRFEHCSPFGFKDYDGTAVWRPVGVSPLLRFIQYFDEADTLLPHYDASYVYGPNKRTLKSLVINVEGKPQGPSGTPTRFLVDTQIDKPITERDFSDWTREPTDNEIEFELTTPPGSAIVFDHRLLHDSAKVPEGKTKLIMRTDIVYERCGVRG